MTACSSISIDAEPEFANPTVAGQARRNFPQRKQGDRFVNSTATPATPNAAESSSRTWAILSHVGGLLTTWIGPLVIYLIKKSDPGSEFAAANAKEALNFQITLFLVFLLLMITVVGMFLIFVPVLCNLILSIIAAVKASNGQAYRYPLTLRLIK
jgi:uncharacterized Tic20 family protein